MELSERKKTVIIILLLAALAAVSFFLIGMITSSGEIFSGTYNMLDEKKTNVMELMAAAAATSTALSLIPGDAGTPMAEQFADLSGYFMFILAAIFVEKWMVTITGFVAFKVLIPIACLILIISRLIANGKMGEIGIKLILFSLMIFLIIPVSGLVTKQIDAGYQESVKQAIEESRRDSEKIQKEVEKSENDNVLKKTLEKIKGGIKGQLKNFENTLSMMTEAIAVMIVTSCAIPLAVMVFFIWLIKMLTGFSITIPTPKASRIIGRK